MARYLKYGRHWFSLEAIEWAEWHPRDKEGTGDLVVKIRTKDTPIGIGAENPEQQKIVTAYLEEYSA